MHHWAGQHIISVNDTELVLPCEHVGSQIRLLFDELCRKLGAFGEFKADNLLHCNQLSLA